MAAKIIVAVFAQTLLIQSVFSQCAGHTASYGLNGSGYNGLAGPGLVGPGLTGAGLVGSGLAGPGIVGPGLAGHGAGCGYSDLASNGGGFLVTSFSPLAPTGISVISENAIEGSLVVGGSLPFLGTVVLDGVLPTAGTGAVSYGCGNEGVGIVSEGPIATGIVGPAAAYGSTGPVGYGGSAAYGPTGAGFGSGHLGAPAYNGLGGCGCGAVY